MAPTSSTRPTELVGKVGLLSPEAIARNGLRFEVRIVAVKRAYGNLRYVVTPVAGEGEETVNADRVSIL